MSKKILVTSALPYANGAIHLGHILEQIQTDVFVRALRMAGKDAIYLCADDTHGTPIEVNARKQGITPEELVRRCYEDHVRDLKDFLVHHDHFGSTNSEENRVYAALFYERMKAAGHVFKKSVDQAYCEKDGRFLPDRFIRGTCPNPACKAPDQYGDSCEVCGTTYNPADLADARCSLCGTTPVIRASDRLFYDLPKKEAALRAWLDGAGHVQPEVRNFAETWLKEGLKPWDISRDGPYFGFEIPGEPGKYFYVWLDAPIGYVSTTEQYARKTGGDALAWWKADADTEIHHFIGKDIVYFHVLFWPAMLHDAGFHMPDAVHVHGMLTAEGQKLSKSRGTFINARTYLDHLPPELFRYYLCSKFSARVEDLDLNFDDFIGRVNGELVNNLANLFSRSVQIVHGKLDGKIPALSDVKDTAAVAVVRAFEGTLGEIASHYAAREYALAIRKVLDLSDYVNKYIQDRKPWEQLKNDPAGAGDTLSIALNAGKLAAVALHPVLPRFADKVARMFHLHDGPADWRPTIARDGRADLGGAGKTYGPFERLFDRIERKQVDAIVAASRPADAPAPTAAEPARAQAPKAKKEEKKKEKAPEGPPPEITFDDFAKLDLRVGLVKEAKLVEGSDKLLQLTVDLGAMGTRNVFAGIRQSYAPEQLVGRRVVVVANLAPRKMKFGTSEAMVLAADHGEMASVLSPLVDVEPGSRVR